MFKIARVKCSEEESLEFIRLHQKLVLIPYLDLREYPPTIPINLGIKSIINAYFRLEPYSETIDPLVIHLKTCVETRV